MDFSSIKRLDFSLHTFSRLSWTSDGARRFWEPKVESAVRVRPLVFGHAVRAGLYPCALLQVESIRIPSLEISLRDLLGLELAVLERGENNNQGSEEEGRESLLPDPGAFRSIVIGEAGAVEPFRIAWKEYNRAAIFDLLNVPDCCRRFTVRIEEELGLVDPTLAQALNTPDAEMRDNIVRLPNPGLLNTLLKGLRLELLSHIPCSFACADSQALAEGWMRAGRENGYAEEMDALADFLSFPVEWSALHGIAEIKTPLMKISANTDPTPETYRVQLYSERYPEEGSTGLRFPYQPPRFAKITDSESFKKGLTNPIPVITPAENGAPSSHMLQVIGSDPTAMSNGEIDPNAKETKSATGAPLTVRPRSSEILDRTFERLKEMGAVEGRRIRRIHLTNYFNIIELEDGSVGSCMNYYWFKSLRATQRTLEWLESQLPSDPLLLTYLFQDEEPDLLQLSLKACLVGALSRTLLQDPNPSRYSVGTQFDVSLFAETRSVVVIGYGGYMDYFIRGTGADKIHISDLGYYSRIERIEKALDYYRGRFPHKQITISDGTDTPECLAEADTISITGSALCTGTMDELLDWSQNCRTIIVQGQSGGIYPEVLFERGVTMVSTTLKPDNFIDLAVNDQARWRELLEGKLPTIYLRPVK